MGRIIRFVYKLSLYIWLSVSGIGCLYSVIMYIAYNGLGDVFKYMPVDKFSYSMKIDSVSRPTNILEYQYEIDGHTYNSEHRFFVEDMKENIGSIRVLYNSTFEYLSMVEGVPNENYMQRLYLVRICTSLIFFLFAFLIYKFANHDKWINIYSGEKP